MKFLKIIFWILILVIFAFLSASNWHPIDLIIIPGQSIVAINLPLLLLLAFLLGMVPYFILHKATRWSLNRKLSKAQRELEETKNEPTAPTPQEPE